MRGFWSVVAGALTLAFVLGMWAGAVAYTANANAEQLERVEDGGGRRP